MDPSRFNEPMIQHTRLRVWHSIVPEWTNSFESKSKCNNNLATYSIHNWRQCVHVISHSDSESSSDSDDSSVELNHDDNEYYF